MARNKKPLTEEEARLKMADLCARSEQCEYDISQKLYKLGFMGERRDRIIAFLKEKSFIDDFRYARSFARDKCRFSGWGPFKIRQGLLAKRLDNTTITEALEEVEQEDWDTALAKAAETKARSLDLTGEDGKNNRIKLARFLLSRGFSYPDVRDAVMGMINSK